MLTGVFQTSWAKFVVLFEGIFFTIDNAKNFLLTIVGAVSSYRTVKMLASIASVTYWALATNAI